MLNTRSSKAMETHQVLSFSVVVLSLIQFLSSFSPVVSRYHHVQADDSSLLRTYIVHVSPPNYHHDSSTDLENYYKSFLPSSVSNSDESRLIFSYSEVFSGFAAKLTEDEVNSMAEKTGFVRAYPDRLIPLLTTHTPSFLGLKQGRGLWGPSGLGKGVIIGLLDTGVHATHLSFNDDGVPAPPSKWKGSCNFPSGCNNKLIGSKNFVESGAPDDAEGHGTHTASTAAGNFVRNAESFGLANGTASGIAPHAHLAIYKVCAEDGCTTSAIVAGLDAAVKDGVDVLSLSLGGASLPFDEDPIAIGTFAAVEKGIFVSCAGGNAGPSPQSLSNEAPWILTVAAGSIDRSLRAVVELGSGKKYYGESLNQSKSIGSSSHDLLLPGDPSCTFFSENVRGKVVLCDLSSAESSAASAIQIEGGAAVIFLNSEIADYSIVVRETALPSPTLPYEYSSDVTGYANSTGNATASITFDGTVIGVTPAPMVAYFSSRGPNSASPGIMKPDISGPGLNILAAWPFPVDSGESGTNTFSILSGTSMATPHLSGIAALIKGAHHEWSPAAIKSAIITTSDIVGNDGKPIRDEQHQNASFFSLGAGYVNPSKATDPGLVYDLDANDYIAYLCGLLGQSGASVVARRNISCSNVGAISEAELNYPSLILAPGSTVKRTVTNVGAANESYKVEVDAPEGATITVTPKVLNFSKVNEKKTFTVRVSGGNSNAEGNLRWVSDDHVARSPLIII